MKKDILNLENKKIKDIDITDSVWGIKVFPDIIHQYIRYQNAKSRQGSHKTKTRSEVNGRAKKPFAQKGTGGATSMGPVNRDHSISLNKKEKALALKSALSSKMSENNIIFIYSFIIENHKTKNLKIKLSKFDFKSALFVFGDDLEDTNFKMASSNLPRVSSLSHKGINVKDIISYDKIFIEEKSINKISERLSWKM